MTLDSFEVEALIRELEAYKKQLQGSNDLRVCITILNDPADWHLTVGGCCCARDD